MVQTLVFFIRPWLSSSPFNFLLGGLLFPAQIVFSSSAPSYNLMRGRGRPRTKTKKIEKYFSGLIYVISWQWITSSIDSTLRVFCGDEQKVLRFRFFLVKSKELPRSLAYFEISRQFWTVKYALINKLFERNFKRFPFLSYPFLI